MEPEQMISLTIASLAFGAILGVLAVGLAQRWHDRRHTPQLGRKDGAR